MIFRPDNKYIDTYTAMLFIAITNLKNNIDEHLNKEFILYIFSI